MEITFDDVVDVLENLYGRYPGLFRHQYSLMAVHILNEKWWLRTSGQDRNELVRPDFRTMIDEIQKTYEPPVRRIDCGEDSSPVGV